MEGHIDSDYGKMGTGVVRYLMNPIVAVIDKALAGRQMSEFMDTTKSVPILASLKEEFQRELRYWFLELLHQVEEFLIHGIVSLKKLWKMDYQ